MSEKQQKRKRGTFRKREREKKCLKESKREMHETKQSMLEVFIQKRREID